MIDIRTILTWLCIFITICQIRIGATFDTNPIDTSADDSGENFLKAVIDRLKQDRFIDEYESPFENIFGYMRRSVDDYKGDNSPVNMLAQCDEN